MPRVIVTAGVVRGLERCRLFLAEKNPLAARRAAQVIERQFALLETNLEIGRPLEDTPELRELVISFGGSGFVSMCRFEPARNVAYVLAFRLQKEAGFCIHPLNRQGHCWEP